MSIKIKVDAKGLNFDLASAKIKVKCPMCNTENIVTLGQVQGQETVACVGCQKALRLVDKSGSTSKAISNVNNAMDDLKRAIEDLGR